MPHAHTLFLIFTSPSNLENLRNPGVHSTPSRFYVSINNQTTDVGVLAYPGVATVIFLRLMLNTIGSHRVGVRGKGVVCHHWLTMVQRIGTIHPLHGAHVLHGLGQDTFFRIPVAIRTVPSEVEIADEENPCGQETTDPVKSMRK